MPPESNLYVIPNSQIKNYVATLPEGLKKTRLNWVANVPQGFWSGIEWDPNCDGARGYIDGAAAAGKVGLVLCYSIPLRDAGEYSAGGAGSIEGYNAWIDKMVLAVGNRTVIVVLEPDALPQSDRLTAAQRTDRFNMLSRSINEFKAKCPNAKCYIDVGNPTWKTPVNAAELLNMVTIDNAAGFSINVSNYRTDTECRTYGANIRAALNKPAVHYIYDCGRNGNPDIGTDFANQANRRFGNQPKYLNTGVEGCDGWFWIKGPGESDGNNGAGAPNAGTLWPLYLYNDNVGDNVSSTDNTVNAVPSTSGMAQREPVISATSGTTPVTPPPGDTWTPVGPSGLPLDPFYAYGAKPNLPVSTLHAYARKRYNQFMTYTLTQTGMVSTMPAGAYRIQVPDQGFYLNPDFGGTVSEGQAYGMMLTAWFSNPSLPAGIHDPDAKKYFDGLLKYYNFYKNSRGLMNWNITYQGQIADYNGATDGDLDAAMALIIMHRIHGSAGTVNYAREATNLITAIRDWEFVPVTGVPSGPDAGKWANYMTNGDGWGFQTDHYMPDYFRAGWIREFYKHTGDARWLDILRANYPIAVGYWNTNFLGGVVPDAMKRNGLPLEPEYNRPYAATYNSIRMGWGLVTDFLYNGPNADPLAKAFMDKMVARARERWGAGGNAQAPNYDLDLNAGAGYYNAAGAQMFGSGALANVNNATYSAEVLQKLYEDNVDNYFGGGLAAVAAMVMSGIAQPGVTDKTYPPEQTQVVRKYVRKWGSSADSALDFSSTTAGTNTLTLPDTTTGNPAGSFRITASATSDEGGARILLTNSPVRIVQFELFIPTAATLNTAADFTVLHTWTPNYGADMFELRFIGSGTGYTISLVEPANAYFATLGTTVLNKGAWNRIRLEVTDTGAQVFLNGNATADISRTNATTAVPNDVMGVLAFGKFYSTAYVDTLWMDNFEAGIIEDVNEVVGGIQKHITGKASIRRSTARVLLGKSRIVNPASGTLVRHHQSGLANIKAAPTINVIRRNQLGRGHIAPNNAYLEGLIRRNHFPFPSFEVMPPSQYKFGTADTHNVHSGEFGFSSLVIAAPLNQNVDSGYVIPLGEFKGGEKVTVSAYGHTVVAAGQTEVSGTITCRGSLPTQSLVWDKTNTTNFFRKSMVLTVSGTGNAEIVIGLGAYGPQSQGEFHVDGVLIEYADKMDFYFDGTFQNARWTGTAHQSMSELLPKLVGQPQPGKSNLVNVLKRLQGGKGNIRNNTRRLISGRAHVRLHGVKEQRGRSRLAGTTIRTIVGKARITAKTPRHITGKSSLVNRVQRAIGGRSFIVARPFFDGKRFEYKVFDKANKYLGNITRMVISDWEYAQEINTAGSSPTVQLARKADDFNEGTLIKFGNRVEVFCYDQDEPNGVLLFQGEIINYKPIFGTETVEVNLQGFGNRLCKYIMNKATTTETYVQFLTVDPSAIFRYALDRAAEKGSLITYDAASLENTGAVTSYNFNTANVFEVIDKALELCPVNWYYYIDQATNKFHLHQKVNTPKHTFLLDKDIKTLAIEKRTDDIVNVVYFTGGVTGKDANGNDITMYRVYENASSINTYGRREAKKTDRRVTVAATADTMANAILNTHGAAELLVDIEIIDNAVNKRLGFDLELVKMGEMVKIGAVDNNSANASLWDSMIWDVNKWDYDVTDISTLVLQVTKLKYNGNRLTLNLSTTPPDINKRIQDQERNLDALETINNPATPVTGA